LKEKIVFFLALPSPPLPPYEPFPTYSATPVQSRTDFSAKKFVIARSNESPPVAAGISKGRGRRTGQQLFQSFEEIILNTERNFAKKLGSSEELERWMKKKSFNSARREWLSALKRFATGHGLASLHDIHEGGQQTLGPWKAFILASLRLSERPDKILRKRATEIAVATAQGDVEFLKQLGRVLINRSRTKGRDAFLSYSILLYWFAGQLWLMNAKMGTAALCAYTDKEITKTAYRQACRRLGLKGYKDRMRHPPVLGYDAVTGSYQYAASGHDRYRFVRLKK
jgi:hypothetical protein